MIRRMILASLALALLTATGCVTLSEPLPNAPVGVGKESDKDGYGSYKYSWDENGESIKTDGAVFVASADRSGPRRVSGMTSQGPQDKDCINRFVAGRLVVARLPRDELASEHYVEATHSRHWLFGIPLNSSASLQKAIDRGLSKTHCNAWTHLETYPHKLHIPYLYREEGYKIKGTAVNSSYVPR